MSDSLRLTPEQLRWTLDTSTLPFATTDELQPLDEILGQERGVDALGFGIGIRRPGYNILVTGAPRSGRMDAVRKVLAKAVQGGGIPGDLCYLNNFKDPEAPMLIRLGSGLGARLKKSMQALVDELKKEVPKLFESPEYLARKNEINEAYEKKTASFFMNLEKQVKEAGFALVTFQGRQGQPPEVMPVVDGEPTPVLKLEQMVEKGRFPRDEFDRIKVKHGEIKTEIDSIFLQIRALQKEIQEKNRQADKLMFSSLAGELIAPLKRDFNCAELDGYFQHMIDDMVDNIAIFFNQEHPPHMPVGDPFEQYTVNVLVDNGEQQGPPVIIEEYPTYRNLFGSIERIVDRSGVWRTDFSRIKAGSFVRANGGYLILNLLDAIMEPGVWQSLKRALKSRKMEIQTYDPFYLFTTSSMKPEPIEMDIKVIVLADTYLYHMLQHYDDDVSKIFKVRADFDSTMDKTDESVLRFARFIRAQCLEHGLRPFERSAVAALVEEAVRMGGRQEKMAATFPKLTDLLMEADYFAGLEGRDSVLGEDIGRAIEARTHRSSLIEEKIQDMIDRGSIMIDTDGDKVGQINGLAVYSMGDIMFGKPSRITVATSMGKAGIINIEREAELSGSTHNKGVLILGGYLRKMFAQDKPLAVSASIAFEQSYSGVDGDSASSTEMYALLSSLAGVPIKQGIAVTGSVNQNGEVQAIGGVNHKIEGFFACCKAKGLTGEQGVIIPRANVSDLMLKTEVVEAVREGRFHVWSVTSIEEGIELLTGKKAGVRRKDGSYPKGGIFALVDQRLKELAQGMVNFGKDDEKQEKA
ncbi:MAG: AAA family ATPase [Desulfomicrobium sp.]|nr:AAA family ATPase [Desulfomicrobium sp.]